jgi:plasmid stabilization system protein ParE
MSLPVIIEAEAIANLIQAAKWWANNRDGEQALRWHERILAAIETLADNPGRCILARENAKSNDELRKLHFGLSSRPTHRVIFAIHSDAVCVLSVRHAAQDDWNPADR